ARWHAGRRSSLETIRNGIVRVLKRNDSQDPRERKHRKDDDQRATFDKTRRDIVSSAPEDPLRLLELEDMVQAWCRQAGCTAYDTAVVYLKLQEASDRAIADQLHRSEDGVTQAWGRALKRLQDAYGPEEVRRLIM